MAEPAPNTPTNSSAAGSEAGVTQIREVTKWLVAAFAAVGVALAAGSQLSEIGTLSDWRLVAAFGAVMLVLAGIAGAILSAIKVLTPASVSIGRLVAEEGCSAIGKEVRQNPTLLQGHGKTIREFDENWEASIKAEDEAWKAYEKAKPKKKAGLEPAVEKAQAERQRTDATLRSLLAYARFLEVDARFRKTLIAMFVAGALAALGIAGFAWAAHPEKKSEGESAAVVPASPAEIEVELTPAGKTALEAAVGAECAASSIDALALGGSPEAIEAVTIPSENCELARFVLTPSLGTFKATEEVELTAKAGTG